MRQFLMGLSRAGDFDAARVSAQLSSRIICNLLFGKDILTRGDENAIIEAVHLAENDIADSMFRVIPRTPRSWWLSRKRLHDARRILSLVIEKNRSRAKPNSLFATLQEIGLSGEALRDVVMLMMIAGHHTSGAAGAWLLYHLALEAELAQATEREARELSDDAGELQAGRPNDATVSRGFVHETLRLYPSSHWIAREVKNPVELGGRRMPIGTTLIVCPWHLHRDPRFWHVPEQFRTDRSYVNKAYIPFGYGPRACIGASLALLELQLLALEVASAFHVEIDDAPREPRPIPSVTLLAPPIKLRLRIGTSTLSDRQAA
jgi:cytochrome P450